MADETPTPLDAFRRAFHEHRKAFVHEYGAETYDEGQVLYRCRSCGHAVVVRDAFYGPAPVGPFEAFLARLAGGWWTTRQRLASDACSRCGAPGPMTAEAAVYARYLAEVGFDYTVEIGPEGPTRCWRMDGRGRVWRLGVPPDEATFHDQTGTFFDLHAGWRWLVERFRANPGGGTLVAEVQPGYVIGVRRAEPGHPDPARREDPDLEGLFSRFDRRTYDTLEFLADEDPAHAPFHGERYGEWLGEAAAEVGPGGLELFALADSGEFLACIEDLCARRGVAVEWVDPEGDMRVALHHGPLRLELAFAYPYLRTLHTGRSFHEGARAWYLPVVDALDDALDLLRTVQAEVRGYDVSVSDGTVLVVRDQGEQGGALVGRWNLMNMVGRMAFRGTTGRAELLRFLGYDAGSERFLPRGDDLTRCPVCGEPARVGKVLRPLELLGVDPRTLVGMPIGGQLVYFTLECPVHVTPVEPGPGRDLQSLEVAYREGLDQARATLLEVRPLELVGVTAHLLVGFDLGSLVLEPARVRAVLRSAGLPDEGQRMAYAFFPDALVVSVEMLGPEGRRAARIAALEAVQPRFPARLWPLAVARQLVLDVDPRGTVERPA